ncbi:MAG: Unknown protein [uncultured Sulfurovum sp.]|uniref:Hydrazine synthase alpha subunit middle domain-containing protein n=1 Tax=uncultured Sulfurovum sp. TaxID=269237 RepID=A0A6S6SRS8_9BACT|nr:MAG: Unknown protein [uncultured Sulfurovum sp.]
MKKFYQIIIVIFYGIFLIGCISSTDKTVESGTADITECAPIQGVLDGADFIPKTAISNHEDDGRTHPDLFYIAWAQLDARTDLRFPEEGYDDTGFEDKLLVSRKEQDGSYKTWQIYPALDNECSDVEKVRIQSFDVAPDGRSLYISMSKPVFDPNDTLKANDLNPNRNLGIFKMDISTKKITPITHDYSVSYSYPTYIGNDEETNHEMLIISKTVTKDDIPMNYKTSAVMLDEYDRAPAPLIHKLDTVTGSITRIGFNNSHQTEPVVINQEGNIPLVVFTEWEHQATVNRFSLWKMQIDGSDNFMFYGQEARPDNSQANIYQARQVKSGPYKDYILMGQATRTGNMGSFIGEGDILMTKRAVLDLRSPAISLSKLDATSGVEYNLARNPEHYNDESFAYAYRADVDSSYGIYIKDYPEDINATVDSSSGKMVISADNYHFMQPRSYYPPVSKTVAPGVTELSENRISFTNDNLNGKSGFLVETLGRSNNGVQNQLNGIDTKDIRMQFFVPSHHFSDSYAIGLEDSQELTIPSSRMIETEADGSLGVILKEGLYVWKVNKKFEFTDGSGNANNLWLPIRVERQEVSFVKNRVNACNQCHQDRNQDVIDHFENYVSTAQTKMKGNLADVINTDKDISEYNATNEIPDFQKNIAPLFAKPALNGGGSCISCHNATDKLNLSNMTGISVMNATYRNFVLGAHKMPDSEEVFPYNYTSINPMGMDDEYHPAPFLWSLLLNDDLTVPEDEEHSNTSSRDLDRNNDYGAKYSENVLSEINRVNALYDHSKHWSSEDTQAIITYGSTRLAAGLSDKISFIKNSLSTNTPQAQKAYQALVANCYSCHNNHTSGGMNDNGFEDVKPKEKRFNDNVLLRNTETRFVVHRYLANKGDTKYSQYSWQSNLRTSMSRTLGSALHRIDFNDIDNSELLVYARGYYKASNGDQIPLNDTIKAHSGYMTEGTDAYTAVSNWLNNISMTNQEANITTPIQAIVLKEYDEPGYIKDEDNNSVNITWSDADEELSQAFISGSGTTEHTFNDSMLALEYQDFVSAKLKAYAILGDRGDQNFTFTVTDGLNPSSVQTVPVTVTSDYIVPEPNATLPPAYLYFTDRNTSMLKKLDTNGSIQDIGEIEGFNADWTTMYRRADKGWLYFLNQEEQRIYVVEENSSNVLFNITLNHEPNKETVTHKQTMYLLWWRPAEGTFGEEDYRAGELQGLLESKLSKTKNGDFYVSLGDGESSMSTVVPEWRTKMPDGGNTIGVYVWRQATFMSKFVNEGMDRLNVLNLVTGKAKSMTDFSFEAKTVNGVDYNASDYHNVRAIVVAEDGAFYGFNKDLNTPVETFNFDPIEKIQKKVLVPTWLQNYIDDYQNYATPFLVIEPRE